MDTGVDRLMLLVILSNLALLVAPRLGRAISLMALQGIFLGLLAIVAHSGTLTVRALVIGAAGFLVRGALFPLLLRRAAAQAGVVRDFRPLLGYVASALMGIVMLGGAMALGERLPLHLPEASKMILPASLFTIFTGLFLIVARRKALTQCLGYLVFENGIYGFGVATVAEVPALIELGALLDVLVAVLVMGIAAYRITEEFDHMDTVELTRLRG